MTPMIPTDTADETAFGAQLRSMEGHIGTRPAQSGPVGELIPKEFPESRDPDLARSGLAL